MKKTVTLPDGTIEVLEGTPEEIAAHEKLIRERANPKRKPDVLKGSEEKSDNQKWQELMDALQKLQQPSTPYWPNQPIWVAPCSRCHSAPCQCQTIDLTPWITYRTTATTRPIGMLIPGDGVPLTDV